MKTQQRVKVHLHNGEIKRFSVTSLKDLKEELKITKEIMKYQDDEKDFVLLEKDNDWEEMIAINIEVLVVKVFEGRKEEEKEFLFKNKLIICNSSGMKEDVCKKLLIKHNGDLQKLLNEYYLIEGEKQLIKKQVSLNNEEKPEKYYYELEKKFRNKIIILKSYGMEKRLCLDLLEKHNGNLQKLLNDYNLIKEGNIKSIKKNFFVK